MMRLVVVKRPRRGAAGIAADRCLQEIRGFFTDNGVQLRHRTVTIPWERSEVNPCRSWS